MNDEEFMALVEAGVAALPAGVRKQIENVAFVIADEPTPEQAEELHLDSHTTLFGLYEGVPRTSRSVYYQALPDKITIFKNPILSVYDDPDDIAACVEHTVWHEVAHHFGMDESAVRREEEKRGKTH